MIGETGAGVGLLRTDVLLGHRLRVTVIVRTASTMLGVMATPARSGKLFGLVPSKFGTFYVLPRIVSIIVSGIDFIPSLESCNGVTSPKGAFSSLPFP